MRRDLSVRFVFCTLFGPSILCMALLHGRAHRSAALAQLPFGRYTEAHISQRSASLCTLFMKNPEQIELTSFRSESVLPPAKGQHFWEVDASNPVHSTLAHLTWDADSGELRSVSQESQVLKKRGCPIDSSATAVRTAWDWMHALGFAQAGREWKLDGKPEQNSWVWVVHWKTQGHKASIKLSALSSSLIQASNYPTSAAAQTVP